MNNEISNNPIIEPSNSLANFMKLLLSTSFSPKQETDNYLNKIVHNNKMSLFESLKFKNFCSVGEKTRIIINGNNNNIGTIVEGDYYNMNLNIDMDWLMRFYDSVGCTSNDVLQNLWAKILAGEINHPNSCSLRTLDILKNVTEKEARAFEKVCKFIARCGENDHFIFDVGFLSNYFNGADLLIAADCTAYAYGNFHHDFIRGKITLIGCPKLDAVDYSEKLTEIFRNNDIKSITLTRMTVPCCGGMEYAIKRAIEASGKDIPLEIAVISPDGSIVEIRK